MKTEFPLTRFDPGDLPEPPSHFCDTAAKWFWKLAAWAKVRTALIVQIHDVEDVAQLLARFEDAEDETDRETALLNANIKLAGMGFSKLDLQHLEIPIHESFEEQKQRVKQHREKFKSTPE